MTDFIIKPQYTSGGGWETATVTINTTKAAKVYNEYYDAERKKGDKFTISNKSFPTLDDMIAIAGLSRQFL